MLDALRFSARLGAELGRLGWSRVAPRAGAVPRTLEEVDSELVGRALSGPFPRARVSSIQTLSEDRGTTARRRLRVEYEGDGRPDGAPATLFVKVCPPRITEQLFGRMFRLGPTEVAFYRDVRPALPIRAPGCYGAAAGKGGEFVLVLEDLDREGVSLPTIADPLTVERAEAVVDTLASLHAAYWGDRRFPWLRTSAANPNEAVERFICAQAHGPTLRRFSHLLPDRVRKGAHRVHAERRGLERYWANAPSSLIHGDSHAGNLYFDGEDAGFFDWQVTQHHQGIRDVAYFVILSLDTELRRNHERDLVDRYRRRLRSLGVPPIDVDPDRLWERYRSFSLYAYIATSVTTSMSDLQPQEIAELGLRRAATAVDDLEALKLLDQVV
jgi:hypothetical protein